MSSSKSSLLGLGALIGASASSFVSLFTKEKSSIVRSVSFRACFPDEPIDAIDVASVFEDSFVCFKSITCTIMMIRS